MTQNTTLLSSPQNNPTLEIVWGANSSKPYLNCSQRSVWYHADAYNCLHLSPLPYFSRHGVADGPGVQAIEITPTKNSLQRTHCEVQLISLSQSSQPVQAAALVVILEELNKAWRTNRRQNGRLQHSHQ